jgi:transcriptional regulator with XRE-family HTH domain
MTEPKDQILNGIFHAESLTRLREGKGWSYRELAMRVQVGFVTVWNWERGGTVPKRTHLKKLAHVFQVSISTLFTERKDMQGDDERK